MTSERVDLEEFLEPLRPGPIPGIASMSRDQVAEFLFRNAERIRKLARKKLTAYTRRSYDSEEVLSSVLRRIDGLAADGQLRTANENELWGLIERVTLNRAVSLTRSMERLFQFIAEEGHCAEALDARLERCERDEEAGDLYRELLRGLRSEKALEVFVLRSRGVSYLVISQMLGIPADTARKRWSKGIERLQRTLLVDPDPK